MYIVPKMKTIVILTGAGVSKESGIKTFRDEDGLWEGYDVKEVATPDAFYRNPELVLRFYNERRAQLKSVLPNPAHKALVTLEEKYQVHVITQNVDDLHERAGSSNVLHLHGKLKEARSVNNPHLVMEINHDIHIGDLAEDGAQLRPNIVWFGEDVPMIIPAAELSSRADIFIVIGTSMVVYPAASLIDYVPLDSSIYVVDPNRPDVYSTHDRLHFIEKPATVGVAELVELLMKE